jgi:hypothetical protein
MKTKFKELLALRFERDGFTLASRILDLGKDAEIVAGICREKVEENGEFAKINASLIVEWMENLARNAQATLDLQVEKDKRND